MDPTSMPVTDKPWWTPEKVKQWKEMLTLTPDQERDMSALEKEQFRKYMTARMEYEQRVCKMAWENGLSEDKMNDLYVALIQLEQEMEKKWGRCMVEDVLA